MKLFPHHRRIMNAQGTLWRCLVTLLNPQHDLHVGPNAVMWNEQCPATPDRSLTRICQLTTKHSHGLSLRENPSHSGSFDPAGPTQPGSGTFAPCRESVMLVHL